MRRQVLIGALVVVLVFGLVTAWRMLRTPDPPPTPQPQLADLGTVKSDLFIFARAERAFFAATGRYAAMSELRSHGLLSLPPVTRWPYSYYIAVPQPGRFFIVAVAQGPPEGRPVALAMNEQMEMRQFEPHHSHHHERGRRRVKQLRTL